MTVNSAPPIADDPDTVHVGRRIVRQSNGVYVPKEHVFVPLDAFVRHCVIRGGTGAMKTVILTYLLLQIAKKRPHACFVFVDFGGDKFALHSLRQRANRRMRFISTPHDDAWDNFPPLDVVTPLTPENLVQATNYVVTALSLHAGESFGKGYFGDIAYLTVQDVLYDCLQKGVLTPDLPTLAQHVEAFAKRYRRNDAAQTVMAIRQLELYPQLASSGDPERDILFPRALENGEIVYAFLPGMMEPTVSKIGGFVTWGAALTAAKRVDLGLPPTEVYLVIDEFPVVAHAAAFEKLITLARKYNLRLVLLHQSSEQLRGDSRSTDLRPIVDDNTAVKLYLTSRGDDIDDLKRRSQEVRKDKGGGTTTGLQNYSVHTNSIFEPSLETNDILDASAVGGDGYLIAPLAHGHSDPVRIRFEPICFTDHFTVDNHQRLSNTPLPKREQPAKVALPNSATRTPQGHAKRGTARRRPSAPDKAFVARCDARLQELFDRCQRAEQWRDSRPDTPPT